MSRRRQDDALPDMGRTCCALALWMVVMVPEAPPRPCHRRLPPAGRPTSPRRRGASPPGAVRPFRALGRRAPVRSSSRRSRRQDLMGTWRSRTLVSTTGAGPCSCPALVSTTSCRGSSGNRPTPGRKTSCPRQSSSSGRAGSGWRSGSAGRSSSPRCSIPSTRCVSSATAQAAPRAGAWHDDRGSGRRGHAEGAAEAAG